MNNNKTPDVLKDLKGLNKKKKIKIRFKTLKSGCYSLYFDIWHNNKREYQTLGIKIEGTRNTKNEDDGKIRKAIALRDQKERELINDITGFTLSSGKSQKDFLSYCKKLIENGRNHCNWTNFLLNIRKFTNDSVRICDIDKKFCYEFKESLLKRLSNNTAKTYYSIFKAALNLLVQDDIIPSNPAKYISIKRIETEREFLNFEEIQKLQNTKCKDENTKNAFIFSCFTGLRISDIMLLKFNQIDEGYLSLTDKKTHNPNRIKLNETVLHILNKQRKLSSNDNVFNLKSLNSTNRYIKEWVKDAGINKHITFHCSRHTFATLCLTYDIDLYTVSKLLWHKDIKTTQIYAKLIDKKKDAAVDKLPSL